MIYIRTVSTIYIKSKYLHFESVNQSWVFFLYSFTSEGFLQLCMIERGWLHWKSYDGLFLSYLPYGHQIDMEPKFLWSHLNRWNAKCERREPCKWNGYHFGGFIWFIWFKNWTHVPSNTFTSNLRKISMYIHIFSILKLPLNNFKCAKKYLCTRLSNHASFKAYEFIFSSKSLWMSTYSKMFPFR